MKFLLALFMVSAEVHFSCIHAHDLFNHNSLLSWKSQHSHETVPNYCTTVRTRVLRRISMNLRFLALKNVEQRFSLCTHNTPIDFQLSRMYDVSSSSTSSMMIVLGICFCSSTAAIFRFVITLIRLYPYYSFLSMLNEANHSYDYRRWSLWIGVNPWNSLRQLVMFRYFIFFGGVIVCAFHLPQLYVWYTVVLRTALLHFHLNRKWLKIYGRVGWSTRKRTSNRITFGWRALAPAYDWE